MIKARKMRRVFMYLCVLLIVLLAGSQAFAINPQPEPPGDIQVFIDQQRLSLDTNPVIVEGRTLVPVRAIFEALGAEVEWLPDTQTVRATLGDKILVLQINNKIARINNEEKSLDVPATIVNGRTLVPLRFVGEVLGAQVDWNGEMRQVSITTAGKLNVALNNAPKVNMAFGNLSQLKVTLKNLETKDLDASFIKAEVLKKQPVSGELMDSIETNYIPPQKDFSKYTTFTGNQDGWGGCIGRSMIHVMNIQNEMECPYTPDLSLWYIINRQTKLANGGDVDTKYVLENLGTCAEASLPTDYDDSTKKTAQDGSSYWDFSTMPDPTAANHAEAAYYKVDKLSNPLIPYEDSIKKIMLKYGPVLIEGSWPNDNPTGDAHCMTVVGWDDNQDGGAFKILNSWGDHWNGEGFFWFKYSDLDIYNMDFRYIDDGFSDRTGTQYAYSARVSLEGGANALRNQLTLKIGAADQDPWTFWDRFNHSKCYDDSQDLCLDIPLPEYAADYWPPSTEKKWYIEVTNGNNGAYTLKEFTVARQYKDSLGRLQVETFTFPKEAVIDGGATKKFYIPTMLLPESQPQIIKPDLRDSTIIPRIIPNLQR